jgi:copper transport protein
MKERPCLLRLLPRVLVCVLVVCAVALLGAGSASAHAQLESTEPGQSSVLLVPPRQVVLHFGEPVEIDFGSIRVLGPDGRRVDEGGTHHPAGDSSSVAISLPPRLGDGTYVVAWRVISADSHPVHGAFVFSIGTSAGTARASTLANALSSVKGSTTVGVVDGLVRFGLFAGLLFLVGLGAVAAVVWPRAVKVGRVRRLLWWSWSLALLCSLAGIALQGVYAASLPLTRVFSPTLFSEVIHTRFGEVEALRLVLLVAAVPIVLGISGRLGTPGRDRWWVLPGSVLGVALLATPGLSGHASTGADPALGLALDVVHLGAAALWTGGLVVLCALLVPGVPADERPERTVAVARRFSPYAVSAVVVVVASGLIVSVRQVGSRYALLHTVYGRTLIVKVLLVVVLVALGALSRRIVIGRRGVARTSAPSSPSISPPRPSAGGRTKVLARGAEAPVAPARAPARLRTSVVAELVALSAVLVATVLLVNAAPAKQAASEPFSHSFDVLGVQVNAIVDPARVGPGNTFHFYVLGSQGEPKAIPELDAVMSLPSSGIGPIALPVVVAGPGHFLASGVDIPLAGDWTLEMTVRTSAVDEQEVFVSVPVH